MICKQCGNEIAPDAKFCGVCGAPNDAAAQVSGQPVDNGYSQPQYSQPVQQYNQPQYNQPQYAQPQYNAGVPAEDPVERSLSKSILIFGILALAFCCTFYLAFLSIIFGAIALSKAKKYAASYPLTGRAKTGRILGLIGMIIGIVLTVIVTIVIIAAIVAAASYSSYYYY